MILSIVHLVMTILGLVGACIFNFWIVYHASVQYRSQSLHRSNYTSQSFFRQVAVYAGWCLVNLLVVVIFNFQMNALINDYEKASSNCYGDDFWATAVTDQTAVDHPLGWFEWRMALRRLRSASNVD